MTASGYGAADRLKTAGDTATGTIVFAGSPPLALPSGTSGYVLMSDSAGNLTLQASGSGVTLDTTAGDIQPDGTSAAAGSVGKAADAGHIHPAGSIINGVTISGTPASGKVPTCTSSSAATWQTPAGGVTLDSTSSDIQPLGTQAAGSSGQAAAANHVHPTTSVINGVTVSGSPALNKTIICTSGSAATWQTPASGVTIDTTSSDIAVLAASAVAGSIGLAADSGHQHPYTGLALLSGAAFTGNTSVTGTFSATKAITAGVVSLTDGSSIAVNASLGSTFRVTLGGNRTMAAPSGATDGQMIIFEITQDLTGSRTITWASGSGGYLFTTALPAPTLTTTASYTDEIGFKYVASSAKWRCLAVSLGYSA